MKYRIQQIALLALATTVLFSLSSCDDATVADHNMERAADNFEVMRRAVFYNGITGEYMLTVEGLLSIKESGPNGKQLEVLVKTGPKEFKQHFLGLSDNVTYFVEHLEGTELSTHHYRVVFKPSVIVPDPELR